MKYRFLIIIVCFLCLTACNRMNKGTSFPETYSSPDYVVKGYLVKIAFPVHSDSSRVWIKGSKELTYAKVFYRSQSITKTITLDPPYYTQIISLDNKWDSVQIHFSDDESKLDNSAEYLNVFPKSKQFLEENDSMFSFLFYGCFQPFMVNEEQKSQVLHRPPYSNYYLRKTFHKIAQLDSINVYHYHSNNIDTLEKRELLLNNPKVILGTGDQIYTDAGYALKKHKNHPLSAWTHRKADPLPTLEIEDYKKHLNNCYLHFNSFGPFETAFSKLPYMAVWDDHEIRDGWGSHGDEYDSDGELTKKLKPYYLASKEAYKKHQWSIGPNTENTKEQVTSFEQETTINGVNIFAFDLRSARNCEESRVISDAQFKKFQRWCQRQSDSTKEVIIMSSIPFFYEPLEPIEWFVSRVYDRELKDDAIDAWSSKPNFAQRNQILSEIIELREKGIKPIIISGDVHVGAMISVWYKDKGSNRKENKRLCYEFVFSGLSHEKMGENADTSIIKNRSKFESVRWRDVSENLKQKEIFPIHEFTRARINFGGIEFRKDTLTKASLFVLGDKDSTANYIAEMELELNWKESFTDYYNRCSFPDEETFIAPFVPYNDILFQNLD